MMLQIEMFVDGFMGKRKIVALIQVF